MKNIVIIVLALFCATAYSYAQKLSGKLTDVDGSPILMANILLKEVDSPAVIQEFMQARGGQYQIVTKKAYNKLMIEVTAFGYVSDTLILDAPHKDSTYTLDFVLKLAEMDLKEVVVTAKKSPFEVKEDTVSYNVSAYSDGTERKIQDIIKKLPGIEVNEKSGEIKYKGKPVEAVTLEGDDLFGGNYSIGTKNINVNMVEQVQAIENYSANPLLKGIEAGDKVSLNLKLKKGKVDFSGNAEGGAGLASGGKGVFSATANLLAITKTFKSYTTGSYNNIGRNDSPFDYFGNNMSVEQAKEKNFFAQKVIAETAFSNLLDDSRANVNNAWFGNHNAIFKIKKRLSVKYNLYYVQDDIFAQQLSQSTLSIDNKTFTTSDERTTHKKPMQYRGDLELKYNTSKTSLLEYNIRMRQENIETPTQVLMNETDIFKSRLTSKDFYLKQNALFTKKIGAKKALQISAFYSDNRIPQILQFNPSVLNPVQYEEDIQRSEFRKNYGDAKITFLGANKVGKYALSVGANLQDVPFVSRLFSTDANGAENLSTMNDLRYKQSQVYQLASYSIDAKNWRFSPSHSLSQFSQKISTQNAPISRDVVIFEPALSVRYTLNPVSFLLGRVGYNQSPETENYLFSQEVLINNRMSITNTPNLAFQKRLAYSLAYRNNNLDKQFGMNLSASYQQITGNFFTDFFIQERTTRINNFFLPENTDNLNFNFMINQFVHAIDTDVKLTANYGVSNYKNILNGSELRNNQGTNFNTELALSTAFDIRVNFRNTFRFAQNQSKNENSGTFTNESLSNMFKVLIKPAKSWFISLNTEYYLPNLQKKQENYFFLDAHLSYSPKDKKYSFSFIANNLLNKNNFRQVQTTDYAINVFQSNLLPRYFLLNMSYSF